MGQTSRIVTIVSGVEVIEVTTRDPEGEPIETKYQVGGERYQTLTEARRAAQAPSMTRTCIRNLLVLAAVLTIGWDSPCGAQSDVPATTGDFLAYCQENYQGCEDKVTGTAVDLIMTHNPNFCDPENDYPNDLTQAVIAWLTARPEIRGQALSEGLLSALVATRPCPLQ